MAGMSVTAFNRRRRELAAKAREQTAAIKPEPPRALDNRGGKPAKPKRSKGGDEHAGE